MRRTNPALVVCLSILAIPTTGWTKGPTFKIEIQGDYLESPIEITDPRIVGSFSIWNGPGVFTYSAGQMDPPAWADPTKADGRFIDWPRGWATERPKGLQRLEVTFFIGDARAPDNASKYVFLYEVDASNGQGYVYLPRLKNEVIVHFVEGNWFHASKAWDEIMIALIAQNVASESVSANQDELRCTIGTGLITSDGIIEFYKHDERGDKVATLRLQPTHQMYPSFREHIGNVTPDEETEVSCWPRRTW